MKQLSKLLIVCIISLLVSQLTNAQEKSHVRWSTSVQSNLEEGITHRVRLIADIDSGFFIYSRFIPKSYSGIGTNISIDLPKDQAQIVGLIREDGSKIYKDDIVIYKNRMTVSFDVNVLTESTILKWYVEWTECDLFTGECKRIKKEFKVTLDNIQAS